MRKPISVTTVMYEAKDGTLHSSEAMADFHDKMIIKENLEEKILDVLRPKVEKHHFTALQKTIIPYNMNHWYDTQDERDKFMRELACLVIDNWDNLYLAMEDKS